MTWAADIATLGARTELSKQSTDSNDHLLSTVVHGRGPGLFPKAG
jgi:hypothetical protein